MTIKIDFSAVRAIPPKEIGNRGFFPSTKVLSNIVEYESQLERDLYLQLEHAPDVKLFQYQPITLFYIDKENNQRHYTPDVYIEFQNGLRVLVEVKDLETMAKKFEEFKERWDKCEIEAKKSGILFTILTEQEIRTARLGNIWFTLGASKIKNNKNYLSKLNTIIPLQGITYNELCLQFSEMLGFEITKASQIICYAIYYGLIFVDTFSIKLINSETIIRKRNVNDNDSPFKPLWDELEWYFEQNQEKSSNQDIYENKLLTRPLSSLTIPEEYKILVDQRLEVIHSWLKQPSKLRTPKWRQEYLSNVKQKMKKEITERTIYRWIKAYEENDIEGLIPKFDQRRKNTIYSLPTTEILEEARKEYLKPEGTLDNAYEMLKKNWNNENVNLPSISTLYRYICNHTPASELAYTKFGARFHKANFTPDLGSFQGAIIPMQVLQLDNTQLDIFPVDSDQRLPLSSPYITAAIDCYTRMITGFYLSLSPSSSQSILETLVQSILSKKTFTEIYGTESDWPIQGFPVLILVDNGMDYRAKIVKEFCMKYDIILEFAPIRTPRYKAYIEHWFNVIHQAIVQEKIPGYRMALYKRIRNPDLDPEAEAVLTMQELETWVHQWVIDQYHFNNPYDDHVPAPYLRYSDASQGKTKTFLPLPREPPMNNSEVDLLYLSALDHKERLLKRSGVQWKHLKYNNQQLAGVFAKIGDNHPVTMLLDRRDIRQVWVISPIDGKPIPVGLASGWAKIFLEVYGDMPINASAWVKNIQAVREQNKDRITPYVYKIEHSRLRRQENISNAKKETKNRRKEGEKRKENQRKLNQKDLHSIQQENDQDATLQKKQIETQPIKVHINLPEVEPYPIDKKKL